MGNVKIYIIIIELNKLSTGFVLQYIQHILVVRAKVIMGQLHLSISEQKVNFDNNKSYSVVYDIYGYSCTWNVVVISLG